MKALVVYDSVYGNTRQIASSIGKAIDGNAKVFKVNEVEPQDFKSSDVILIGSPTCGGRPTQAIQQLLRTIPVDSIKGKKAAAFDTRMAAKWVKIFGFAADKIARELSSRGAVLLGSQGFFVENKEGPLTEGETEHAAKWAKGLIGDQSRDQ